MDKKCATCKFYEPINHRGQRYPKGFCQQHTAQRISGGYEIHLSISSPHEFACGLYEPAPQPVYAMDGDEIVIVPPAIVAELLTHGWVLVSRSENGPTVIVKEPAA